MYVCMYICFMTLIDLLKSAIGGATPLDFFVQSFDQRKQRGIINMYGIESPDLTSSLALAEYVKLLAVKELE